MAVIVFKLGGSLLNLPDLSVRLHHLFADLDLNDICPAGGPVEPLIVVGGGEIANVVRGWDAAHRLGDRRSHELALTAMSLNARLVSGILPRSQWARTREEAVKAWHAKKIAVLDPAKFLSRDDAEGAETLPCSWDVTSDSVAAHVALRWPAQGLVLVKSVARPAMPDSGPTTRRPEVDAYFARLAPRLPYCGWVNLRAERPRLEDWSWPS